MFLQAIPPGPIGRAAEWLEPFGPLRLEFGAAHVMRVDFDPLPHEWVRSFADVSLDALELHPDGHAVVSVTGQRAPIARFAARLEAQGHGLDVRHVAPAHLAARLLTPAQEAAIQAAIQHGYYEIPRPINLHQLGAKMGVGSASLSERLRRAEGRIIRQFAAGLDPTWSIARPAERPPTTMPKERPGEEG